MYCIARPDSIQKQPQAMDDIIKDTGPITIGCYQMPHKLRCLPPTPRISEFWPVIVIVKYLQLFF